MKWIASLAMAGLLIAFAQPLLAHTFGDPVPTVTPGELNGGADFTNMTRSFKFTYTVPCTNVPFFGCVGGGSISATGDASWDALGVSVGYGLSNGGMVQGELNSVTWGGTSGGGGSTSGTEIGVTYRQAIGDKSQLSGYPLRFGVLGGYETGSAGSLSYSEYQVAGGGSLAVAPETNVYAAAVYDNLDMSLSSSYLSSGSSFKVTSQNNIGVYGGAEYKSSRKLLLGAEYHLIFETGFALYARYVF